MIYISYLYLLPHFEGFTHHCFNYLIFKPNFTPTNVFLLYFCCVLMSTLVQFGPIQPTLVYCVHFDPVWSNSILFSTLWSYSVLFSPNCSNLVHCVHFGLIWSTLVLFGPFGPLWSYLVHFGYIQSFPLSSYSVLFNLFQSTLVLFNILRFTLILSSSL